MLLVERIQWKWIIGLSSLLFLLVFAFGQSERSVVLEESETQRLVELMQNVEVAELRAQLARERFNSELLKLCAKYKLDPGSTQISQDLKELVKMEIPE